MPGPDSVAADASYSPMFPLAKGETPWRKISDGGATRVPFGDGHLLKVDPKAIEDLTRTAFRDISHYLRPGHLKQLASILDDPEASSNDKFVALDLLKNANIAAGGVLPMCQDTGTAIVMGKKGERVFTGTDDEAAISRGVKRTYTETSLRYSQMAALDMYKEVNTGDNLPAQIDIYSTPGDEYHFLFIAKGGGSANKTFLYQETKAVLNPDALMKFIDAKMRTLGTAACPPYHLAIVIGGTSAELTLKTVKLASVKYLDGLPTKGDKTGHAFRDVETEQKVLELSRQMGIGAQFGGKYFCHDVRVIRLPRHGASCPIGIGVSCAADRQVMGKITADGVFIEQLEQNPAQYLPEITEGLLGGEEVKIDLNRPMSEIREILSKLPIKTRVSLSGPMVVARDIAHAKLKDRMIYYAGPAKTPKGYATGAFGPTTAGRMDSYVDLLMANGGGFVTLAKGNRSKQVTDACKKHGGFYLASIGGPGARLAQDCIKKVEVLEYPELGMEAIWQIEVVDFPAFVVVDDKGNDFFAKFQH